MSINLLSLATQFITPDMIARLAASLGLDKGIVGKLITAGLPSIMAGLGGVAATPGGAKGLSDILGAQGPNALETLAAQVGGAGQSQMLAQGGQMLSGLIGGKGFDALAGALGGHAGADANATKSVLGFLAPAVMGTIAQHAPGGKIDAGSLTGLFADQKSAISAAIPAGLASALGATGILSSLGNMGQGATSTVQSALSELAGKASSTASGAANMAGNAMSGAANAASGAMSGASNAASNAMSGAANIAGGAANAARNSAADAAKAASGGIPGWLWIVGGLLVAALAWWFLGRTPEPVKQAVGSATSQVSQISSGVADAAKSASETLSGLTSTLTSIKDTASATAALPKLREAAAGVDKLQALTASLPADAKKTIGAPVATILPGLRQLINQVLGMSGVGDIIKPVVEPLLAKLEAIAKG